MYPWAFHICLHDGRATILPVWLRIMGSRDYAFTPITKTWSVEDEVNDMFASYPILEASDVEVPGWWLPTKGRYPWIPRRHTHTIQYVRKLSQVGKSLREYGSIPALARQKYWQIRTNFTAPSFYIHIVILYLNDYT